MSVGLADIVATIARFQATLPSTASTLSLAGLSQGRLISTHRCQRHPTARDLSQRLPKSITNPRVAVCFDCFTGESQRASVIRCDDTLHRSYDHVRVRVRQGV